MTGEKVLSGEKTEDEILLSFLHKFGRSAKSEAPTRSYITLKEFLEYYGEISASIVQGKKNCARVVHIV